ncbi:fibronectin type III domain-containing protein [Pseudoclavibacter sp. CFCC 13611]|uniref:DUF7507 domain-containing protein n=1 Tax=Pseudoclavibacter sp. CFCC 13611 TaxID=2615178 RepID=UPI0017885392|nr:fibronectin type III domain-containing protein [Pseudoclavibacter sp. CFCC 13611]
MGRVDVSSTPEGVTSVAQTDGKARGSGLWGYAGDVETRSADTGSVYNYGLALSPKDGSLWVTDSAKIVWTSSSFLCRVWYGGTMKSSNACYVGDSKLHRYALATDPDWGIGQYQGDGTYSAAANGINAGLGANYAALADAQVLDGNDMPSGQFGGVRGVAVSNDGVAWTLDSDAGYAWLNHANHALRMVNPDGTEAGAIGKTTWPTGNNWANRNDPQSFDYPVGIARMLNGDMIVTSQTPELLKQYHADGTFVRNIYLNQAAATLYPADAGYRSPYSIAVDPKDGTLLVGYVDPGAGNQSFIQRIDPTKCATESVGNPTGSLRDRCEVIDTIGLGNLATGDNQTNATFAIQVEPSSGDIYVGQRSGQISVFTSGGTFAGRFSAFGQGNADGQLSTVRGIAFDSRGFMYLTVAEGTSSARVEIFARTPDPITGLKAQYADQTNTSVKLDWDALATGVTAVAQSPLKDYVVEQSTDNGVTWAVVNTPVDTVNSSTVTGLDPSKSYQFRVSAWNEAGNGDTMVANVDPFPVETGLTVVKTGNGVSNESADDAVRVPAESDVTFKYTVTNTGNVPAEGVVLNDDRLGPVESPAGFDGTLAAGASVTFTADGPVAAGDYKNTATATARSAGQDVTAHDDWYGFGTKTGLTVVKTGNGARAETADKAVRVPAASDVKFNYTVTNTGNVPAEGVVLNDDRLGQVESPAGFDGTLAAGASVTFTADGPVAAGDYKNTATVTGQSEGKDLQSSDEWFGFGTTTGLTVVKSGNGVANDSADRAVHVPAGSSVKFEYTVTNSGNSAVTGVSVSDDKLTGVAAPAGFDGTLAAGASVTFTADGPVAAGDYKNTATVTGQSEGQDLQSSDEWFGFGTTTGLTVVKSGNGVANDSADRAVHVPAGSSVKFEYTVTNSGNSAVTGVSVSDDKLTGVAAPAGFDGTLAAGASVTFTADGPVAAGDYKNTATVTGQSEGQDVTAHDDWYGFGDDEAPTPAPTPTPSAPTAPAQPVAPDQNDGASDGDSAPNEHQLARTGPEVGSIGAGLALLAAGLATVIWSRSRRRSE